MPAPRTAPTDPNGPMRPYSLLHMSTDHEIVVTAPTPEIAVAHAHRVYPNGPGGTPFSQRVTPPPHARPGMAALTPEQVQEILASPEYAAVETASVSVACGDWAALVITIEDKYLKRAEPKPRYRY